MKKIILLILLFVCGKNLFAQSSGWKIHPVFDEEVSHVIETPGLVYFTSRTMPKNSDNETYFSLFRYDKKGDELLPLSTSNILNGHSIRDIIYNPDKGYLAVLYKDYDIDLLYNNGKVVNIPYYKQASIGESKGVNSMAIDPENDRFYMATDFGYVAVNDKKAEVAESRIYGSPLESFCRLGDMYLAVEGSEILMAYIKDPRLSLHEYNRIITLEDQARLYPLSDKLCLVAEGATNQKSIKKLIFTGEGFEIEKLFDAEVFNIENNSTGVTIATNNRLYQFKPDGTYTTLQRPENYDNSAASSENMTEVWNGLKRKGLSSVKKTGEQWSVTRDWMLPNAPSPIISTCFVNHPSEGLLTLSYGYNRATETLWSSMPFQLSGFKQGRWKNFSTSYTNPSRASLLTSANGLVVDPDNNSYVYISSFHNGIARLNLKDPYDIIHLSRDNDRDFGQDGFVVLPYFPEKNKSFANISPPGFDKQGNIWMSIQDWDDEANPHPHFICWTAADRKSTTSASDIKLPQLVEFDVQIPLSNLAVNTPLLKTGNGLIVYSIGNHSDIILILDTSGTPLDTSDDKYYLFPYFVDSDGNSLAMQYVKYIWEDPATGYVWICHGNGVCYFIPSQVIQGNYELHRVKVSRNDGTNLADYLLDGVSVNHMVADGEGRKWFSTAGAGIICTTSDGREIVEEFNVSNSPLPDDIVYAIGYNTADNSLMISTAQGYAEYKLPVSQASSVKEDIKAYPNPVRPDYSGYVTITDIPTGSFVKIVDSAGNLVKELGIVSGFDILWDLSDSKFNRVKSGIYHIMVSPSDETSSYSTVGKILVIS